ncbi:MAG: ATP-binding protein [Desulfarculaceae bacterium]|nr:ATP-binding protein [Desulfarculaceae bacterium]MCF8071481.1 ATP-binding protein [Desulfarculaceae bacterium]MCF8103391.1 ATP-binding protein [Desulfarculaceae bacterium]MCF8118051.1 ATP-binding protein [Desulfarculaceae bacterium]
MIVAVASGKGGTGKTTVAASLCSVWDGPVTAVDLDVEEPNLHLFLKPEIQGSAKALLEVPRLDEELCDACGQCSDVCQFKAISLLGDVLLAFPEMCHGCGACLEVCPRGALSPNHRELGEVLWGRAGRDQFLMGRLRVGEAMSPPLMREVKKRLSRMTAGREGDVIIDCPPGVSCPAVNAVMDSDVILLVSEPTPFGLYDFALAWEAFGPMNKPMGAVINRAGLGDDKLAAFCREKGIPILAELPYSREVAQSYSNGMIVAQATPELGRAFGDLASATRRLYQEAGAKEAAHA